MIQRGFVPAPAGQQLRTPMNSKLALWAIGFAGWVAACGGEAQSLPAKAPGADRITKGVSADDRSRCDFQGRVDREVQETAGPGAFAPNIRRVYALIGNVEDRRRVLVCREVDTNQDGTKDVVRTYNDKGEVATELADSNFDGAIDTWIYFTSGRKSRVERDTNGDGRPNEVRFYVRGRLARIQRDMNHDGKPDVWETYADGRLERMGLDTDHDGRVDRWNRDELLAKQEAIDEARRADEEAKKEAERKAAEVGGDGESAK